MINAIPVVGWFLSLFFSIGLAVPFWLVWTVFGIGREYAYWLPEVYQAPGFWDCVGVFIAIGILKAVFVPRFMSASSSSEIKNKD